MFQSLGLTLASVILLLYGALNAQQIQNVRAIQQGSKVLVTYDLADLTGKPYYVKLLMSKDGGTTFGDELKYVSGDVKNAKAGLGKKILWDAAQEISYYDGNAVFRVEATLKAASLPDPIELKCSKVELINVKGSGARVTVDFLITPLIDATTYLNNYKEQTCVYDISGNQFGPVGGKFGDSPLGNGKSVLRGIPVRSQMFFDMTSESTIIPMLKIFVSTSGNCYTDNGNASFEFRNVPVLR